MFEDVPPCVVDEYGKETKKHWAELAEAKFIRGDDSDLLVVSNCVKFLLSRRMSESMFPLLVVVVGRRPSLLTRRREEHWLSEEVFVCNRGIYEDEYYLSIEMIDHGKKNTYSLGFNLTALTIEYVLEMHRKHVIYISEALHQRGGCDKRSLSYFESLAESFNQSKSSCDLREAYEMFHVENCFQAGQSGVRAPTTLDPLKEDHFNLLLPTQADVVKSMIKSLSMYKTLSDADFLIHVKRELNLRGVKSSQQLVKSFEHLCMLFSFLVVSKWNFVKTISYVTAIPHDQRTWQDMKCARELGCSENISKIAQVAQKRSEWYRSQVDVNGLSKVTSYIEQMKEKELSDFLNQKTQVESVHLKSKRKRWTDDEESKLLTAVQETPMLRGRNIDWHTVSKSVPGKSAKNCSDRYRYVSNPNIDHDKVYTKEEDELIVHMVSQYLSSAQGVIRWTKISEKVPFSLIKRIYICICIPCMHEIMLLCFLNRLSLCCRSYIL